MTSEPQLRVEWIGNERNPVVVIDNFAPDPQAMRAVASDLDFVAMSDQYYPGTRAVAPAQYFETVGPILNNALREFYGCRRMELQKVYYSLSMTPLIDLTPEQRMPHYDTLFENYYAAVHFLCPPEFGGTAFFRQRSTGFETVNHMRHPYYRAALDAEMVEHGLPAPAYADSDSRIFDHLATIEARDNRVVIFRGNTLHTGAVSNTLVLPDNPLIGRLTVVSFLIAD